MCNCHRSRDEECQEECLGEPGQEVRPRSHDVPLLSQSQRARAQTLDLVTLTEEQLCTLEKTYHIPLRLDGNQKETPIN